MPPADLEEIRRRYPAPIKKGGSRMAKEGPDSGVTKRRLLEGLAAGKTVRDIEIEFGMKLNTLSYWVKKWSVEGIDRDQAKSLLEQPKNRSAPPAEPPAASGALGDQEAQKPEHRIRELLADRDRLTAENRNLRSNLEASQTRAEQAEQRERAANVKIGEYMQAIHELEERAAELESHIATADEPKTAEEAPVARAESDRIDELIDTLSRARWILNRVAQ